MRKLALVALVVCLACPAFARERIFGWCEQGNNAPVIGGLSPTTKWMQSFPSATVTIFAAGTTNLSTIYSDNAGTPKSNPFTCASDGYWFAYVDVGRYDVKYSGTGITTPFTKSDYLAFDPTQLSTTVSVVAFSATPTFDASLGSIVTMTLTGNVTSSTITNSATGQLLSFSLCQDATGSRTFSWPVSFVRPPPVSGTANSCSDSQFFYDGTNWRHVGSGDSAGFAGDLTVSGKTFLNGGVATNIIPTSNNTFDLGSQAFQIANGWFGGNLNGKRTNSVCQIDPSNTRGWTGSDVGAWVNAAEADTSCGEIKLTAGSFSGWTTQINFDGANGKHIYGAGGVTSGASALTQLIWTGTGIPFSARSVAGFHVHDIQFEWSNAAFAGPFMDFSHNGGGGSDSAGVEVDHISFFKTGSGVAIPLINLDKNIGCRVHDSVFHNFATYAIQGAAASSYNNGCKVADNIFNSATGDSSGYAVLGPGTAWKIEGGFLELGSAAGTVGLIKAASSVSVFGLAVSNVWVGDNNAATTYTLVDFSPLGSGAVGGVAFSGNFLFLNTNSTYFKMSAGAKIGVYGNAFGDGAKLFDLAAGTDIRADFPPGSNLLSGVITTVYSGNNPAVGFGTPSTGALAGLGGNMSYGGLATDGLIQLIGNKNLPAATATTLSIAGNFGSPVLGKLYVGDGSGWQLDFAKRTGSADTTLFSMKDNGQFVSSVATGTAPLSIASTTAVANLTLSNHPQLFNSSNALQTSAKIYFGTGTLNSGTPSTLTITLTGGFQSSGTYVVVVTNTTTQANPLKVANVSGTQFTVTGPNTVTDAFNWIAIGI